MANDTTDLEKKSLEAHVDLCAQRYKFLEEKLISLREDMDELRDTMSDVKTMLTKMSEQRNNQLISWGAGAIGALLLIIGYLLKEVVLVS